MANIIVMMMILLLFCVHRVTRSVLCIYGLVLGASHSTGGIGLHNDYGLNLSPYCTLLSHVHCFD